MAAAFLTLAALASADTAAGPRLDAAPAATCTAAQKQRHAKALAAFKKAMPKQRAAYFKRHKGSKQRRAYVRKQQAKLKSLQRNAACRVRRVPSPQPPPPPTTPPPATPPPPALARANLGVDSTSSAAGATLRYSFTVRNFGPDAAENVLLSVGIPTGATLVSAPAGCTGTTTISCALGTVAAGGTAAVTVTVRPPAVTGAVTLTATVTSTTTDPSAGNNTVAAAIGVAPADVSLEKSVSHAERAVGRTVSYTLTIRNAGPSSAGGMTVTDPLPAGAVHVSAASATMSCAGTTSVTCTRGGLGVGESASATVTVRLTQPGTIANTASLTTGTPDPRADNESATATTNALSPASLPPATSGPPCAPSLARGPIVHVGHPSTYTEGATDYGIFIRPSGPVRALILFVDFTDAPFSESTSALFGRLAPATSAWFNDASEGRVALQIDSHDTWLRMPQPSTAYGLSTGGYNQQYVRDAIATADPGVNFGPYELVYIIPSAGAAIDRGQSPYAFGNPGLQTAERELRHVTYVGPGYREPWALVHETLHHFGLPDLYDFDPAGGSSRHVGGWDIMSAPVGALFAWHKWKLGWIDAAALRCVSSPGQLEETLTPVSLSGGVKAIVLPTGPSTAYVVEAREPVGLDAALCDFGVLVYTVDATVWSGSGPIRLRPAQTSGAPSACGVLHDAAFDVGPGEIALFEEAGIRVEVLLSSPQGYRVRVTRS